MTTSVSGAQTPAATWRSRWADVLVLAAAAVWMATAVVNRDGRHVVLPAVLLFGGSTRLALEWRGRTAAASAASVLTVAGLLAGAIVQGSRWLTVIFGVALIGVLVIWVAFAVLGRRAERDC